MFRLNRNKQKTHPNSLKESIFGYFSENLGLIWFVSVCYETVLFVSVVSIYVGSKHRNKPKIFAFGFTKQTRNRSCFGLFRFEPEFIFVCFKDTLPRRGPREACRGRCVRGPASQDGAGF